jgi:hypothetical protein
MGGFAQHAVRIGVALAFLVLRPFDGFADISA